MENSEQENRPFTRSVHESIILGKICNEINLPFIFKILFNLCPYGHQKCFNDKMTKLNFLRDMNLMFFRKTL